MSKINRELKILSGVELDILENGKIEADADGYFATKKDAERIRLLEDVMNQYTYGWYIAKLPSVEAQVKSIAEFKIYIINLFQENYHAQ